MVLKRSGPVGYVVKTKQGNTRRCHIDQLLPAAESLDLPDELETDYAPHVDSPTSAIVPNRNACMQAPSPPQISGSRYPSRVRRPPDRFM